MLPQYHSYLLRLWQTGPADNPIWRASLEDPHTHQLIGFESLTALCEHLAAFDNERPAKKNTTQDLTRGAS
jgi:hypothetical protein